MLLITYNPKTPMRREPWNKGKLVGPKPPFKLQEIWAIRIRLDIEHRIRELAMFNLAIDSKLRGCDLAVTGGIIEFLVPKQHLDQADILMVLKQMRGKSVTQRMQRHRLVDLGSLACRMEGSVELPCRSGTHGVLSRKQPAAWQ